MITKPFRIALALVLGAFVLPAALPIAAGQAVDEAPAGSSAPDAAAPYAGTDVSEALAEICAKTDATGLVGMALQDGEVVAFGAAGVRSIESGVAVSPTDPFHLGSCAKAITSTLVAVLIEEGVLSWDTTIGEALPELSKEFDPGYAKVRIEDLLRHICLSRVS